jgi:hypothetical protein
MVARRRLVIQLEYRLFLKHKNMGTDMPAELRDVHNPRRADRTVLSRLTTMVLNAERTRASLSSSLPSKIEFKPRDSALKSPLQVLPSVKHPKMKSPGGSHEEQQPPINKMEAMQKRIVHQVSKNFKKQLTILTDELKAEIEDIKRIASMRP